MAGRYGISDVAFKKKCAKAAVPTLTGAIGRERGWKADKRVGSCSLGKNAVPRSTELRLRARIQKSGYVLFQMTCFQIVRANDLRNCGVVPPGGVPGLGQDPGPRGAAAYANIMRATLDGATVTYDRTKIH